MVNSLISWLIAIAAVYPLGMTLMNIGYKPVDIVLSDLLFLFVVLSPIHGLLRIPAGVDLKKLAIIRVAAVAMIGYCIATALVGYAMTSDTTRVLSATKFFKPMAFVPLGYYFATVLDPWKLLRRVAIAFGVVMLITFATTVCTPGFPRCSWGSHFLTDATYGYRNAFMTFCGVLVPLLMALGDSSKIWLFRQAYFAVAAITGLIVLFSMARSSAISMAAAVVIYYIATRRWHVPAIVTGIVAFLGIAGFGLMRMESEVIVELRERIELRFQQTMENGDAFSGRTDIWFHTLELAADRPVFGYLFEPYSNYSADFDTPHQQYLEVLYKGGIVGCVLYAWILFSGLNGLMHLKQFAIERSEPYYLAAALISVLVATLIGNLSQPNLTYSLLGNLIFLLLGLTLNRHAAAGLVPGSAVEPTALSARERLPELAISSRHIDAAAWNTPATDSY